MSRIVIHLLSASTFNLPGGLATSAWRSPFSHNDSSAPRSSPNIIMAPFRLFFSQPGRKANSRTAAKRRSTSRLRMSPYCDHDRWTGRLRPPSYAVKYRMAGADPVDVTVIHLNLMFASSASPFHIPRNHPLAPGSQGFLSVRIMMCRHSDLPQRSPKCQSVRRRRQHRPSGFVSASHRT